MKKLTLSFLLLFFISFGLFAQSEDPKTEMNKFLSKSVKYPTEARANDVSGNVTISIQFDEAGYPVGEPEIYGGDESLSEEILRTFALLRENWNPEYLDGKTPGEEYLMSFKFILQKGEEFISNPLTKYKNQKPFDPLESLTEAIEKNPFSSNLYQQRSEYYAMNGEMWLSKLDYNQSKFLKENEITNIVIVGYGSTNQPKAL